MNHSIDDASFLQNLPFSVLQAFRDQIYSPAYIASHPAKFLNADWVDLKELKEFINQQSPSTPFSVVSASSSPGPPRLDANHTRVKEDPDACFLPDLKTPIKEEPINALDLTFDASQLAPGKTNWQTIQEGGKEVLVLDDSESEEEDLVLRGDRDDGMSSDTAVGDIDGGFDSDESDAEEADSDVAMSDIEFELQATLWLDDGLVSCVSNNPCKITRQRSVTRVEYLDDLPSYWPIPEVDVAYILDLSDPKFNIKDKDGKLLPVDTLICNKDQDSWKGGSGSSDSKPLVSIFGEEDTVCRRRRQKCAGVHVCENVNVDLLKDRRDLNPKSLKDVINAQVESRVNETDSTARNGLSYSFPLSTPSLAAARNRTVRNVMDIRL
ncbi:hypothetical protein M413DRAFT_326599 [Hebeloma cylindrosporum]|uniref:Uncharacterized protein n=1 Tax=Hebeloma cylindrosporum TaxID=76867 RepID=A0A0C2XCN6_HEBCY|nr:hypothetical protein M413DRAFT_326599 [Hebeloma cylindrosporum h7]